MNFAILFSGQGLQTTAHIHELLNYAQQYQIDEALNQVIPQLFNMDTTCIDLYDNSFAQPFIFALQWCRFQHIQSIVDDITVCAGYSLGELSALMCSSRSEFSQGLMLAKQRAELMSQATTQAGGLISISGLNLDILQPILFETDTELSIHLSPSTYIAGGQLENLQQLWIRATQIGAQVKSLNVSIPSHTSLMKNAVEPYRDILHQQQLGHLSIPIVSGGDAIKYYQTAQAIDSLIYQMDHPVNWSYCIASVIENLPDIILEIGPGSALTRLIPDTSSSIVMRSFDDFKTMDGLTNWLKRF